MDCTHRQDTKERRHYMVGKSVCAQLRPKVLYAGELKRTTEFRENRHSHDFCEILFVREGKGVLHLEEGDFPIAKGDIMLYNPGVMHAESAESDEGGMSMIFCGLTNLKIGNMETNYILESEEFPVVATGTLAPVFERYFADLISEVETKLSYYDEISECLVKIILDHILRLISFGERGYDRTNESFERARAFIDQNYTDIGSIEDVCRSLYISRYYLNHLFKEYSGMSPLKYVIVKRMEKAKQLLAETDLSLNEIGLRAGYVEMGSFFKTFKKTENMTPSQYRAAARKTITPPLLRIPYPKPDCATRKNPFRIRKGFAICPCAFFALRPLRTAEGALFKTRCDESPCERTCGTK